VEDFLRRAALGGIFGAVALALAYAAVGLLFRPLAAFTIWTVLGGLVSGWLACLVGALAVAVFTHRKG
jgi:hypothetical protein